MTTATDTAALVAEARRLADAATPGPWYRLESPWLPRDCGTSVLAGSPDPHVATFVADLDWPMLDEEDRKGDDWNDAAFIAWAREGVPRLAAALEAASAREARLREALEACVKAHETGRYEPAQQAYNVARAALGDTP